MRPSSDAGNKRSGSRYVLGDLLGRGGMAEVFAGHAVGDHGFQKPVAIKRLLPELANDEVFVERLIEEAKLLVGMQHGHIVSVLDLAREGDDVFLVMEFVDGPSLRQLIKARGARGLSLGVATYIVQSAAAGLEFAHARPGGAIIHADISPSNLLLTTSGEVRVADFGIARREGLGHGVVEGKWAYMAPEQARGEPLTPRSDVFALGVVFYELLTGQHPFGRAVTPNERDQQIQIIPPRVVKPSIPPGLDAICMRALAHSPRDRYARMQQMIDAVVEERFTTGLREGASDLAQAIRDVAPKSDVAAPRTMHTDRPVTLMTRSLLREVTPARRPSRPSRPPLASASELPSSDEFAVQPTVALTAGVPTEMLADEFPAPSSGEQTVARMVDQVALAQAAQAAQAMLVRPPMIAAPAMAPPMSPAMAPPMPPVMSPAMMQVAQAAQAMLAAPAMVAFNPAALRADGTPMPPFRAVHADVRGEELASVVGGHTLSHGAGIAVESRYRWTLVVLGMAALIGVVAAIV
ncbi:MAG TPA: serine/threonine-protein kinase, partial [Kofleriaceae bacterium]|nr:serine/threonine-protein kinase [Kofleriaceae bacterium]